MFYLLLWLLFYAGGPGGAVNTIPKWHRKGQLNPESDNRTPSRRRVIDGSTYVFEEGTSEGHVEHSASLSGLGLPYFYQGETWLPSSTDFSRSTAGSGTFNISYDNTALGSSFLYVIAVFANTGASPTVTLEGMDTLPKPSTAELDNCFCENYRNVDGYECTKWKDVACQVHTYVIQTAGDVHKSKLTVEFEQPLREVQQLRVESGKLLDIGDEYFQFKGYTDTDIQAHKQDGGAQWYRLDQLYGLNAADNQYPLRVELEQMGQQMDYHIYHWFESSSKVYRLWTQSEAGHPVRIPFDTPGPEGDMFMLEIQGRTRTGSYPSYRLNVRTSTDLRGYDTLSQIFLRNVGWMLLVLFGGVIVYACFRRWPCRRNRTRDRWMTIFQQRSNRALDNDQMIVIDMAWRDAGGIGEPERNNGASAERINRLTSRSYDSTLIIDKDAQTSCPISLEEFEDGEEIRTLPCGHMFKRDYIDKWLLSDKTCPVCRNDIDATIKRPETPDDGNAV